MLSSEIVVNETDILALVMVYIHKTRFIALHSEAYELKRVVTAEVANRFLPRRSAPIVDCVKLQFLEMYDGSDLADDILVDLVIFGFDSGTPSQNMDRLRYIGRAMKRVIKKVDAALQGGIILSLAYRNIPPVRIDY